MFARGRNVFKADSILGIYSRIASLSTGTRTTNIGEAKILHEYEIVPSQPVEKDRLYKSLNIELRSIDPTVLKSYFRFATTAAKYLGIEVGHCWAPRKANHDRLTLLKSVHIFKKHRVQYEIRTHFHFLQFHKLTGSTMDTFLEYIERNLPEGVAFNATKVELQKLPEHLKEPLA